MQIKDHTSFYADRVIIGPDQLSRKLKAPSDSRKQERSRCKRGGNYVNFSKLKETQNSIELVTFAEVASTFLRPFARSGVRFV